MTDGDTISVLRDKEQIKIRLYWMDILERRQAFGTKAKQFTSEMVFGKVVEMRAITADHYRRTVGHVYVDGASLNGDLIRA